MQEINEEGKKLRYEKAAVCAFNSGESGMMAGE